MSAIVIQRDVLQVDMAGCKPDGVGLHMIECIGEIDFHPEVFGEDVADHVDILEASPEAGLSGCVSADR